MSLRGITISNLLTSLLGQPHTAVQVKAETWLFPTRPFWTFSWRSGVVCVCMCGGGGGGGGMFMHLWSVVALKVGLCVSTGGCFSPASLQSVVLHYALLRQRKQIYLWLRQCHSPLHTYFAPCFHRWSLLQNNGHAAVEERGTLVSHPALQVLQLKGGQFIAYRYC